MQYLFAAAETQAQGSKIQGPDYVMLIGYFVLMLGIGLYFYRYMRGMKVFFSGGNKIPWWLSGISFYMSSFSAYAFVAYSGLCFKFGWVGVTLFWVMIPATIISVTFFATRWRRARIDSPTEFLESRYSGVVRQLFVWTGLPAGVIDDSLKLIATGTIVQVGMGFDLQTSIIACGAIMVAYTFMGGLWAVTVTDFVQFTILAVAVVAIFPLSIYKAGGFASLIENSPKGFFSMTTDTYNWYYVVLTIALYSVAFSSTHWHLIQKYFCVPAEKDAKKVGWLVIVLYIIGPPLFFMPAIAARQFMPDIASLEAHDTQIYPRLCAYLMPVGMLGLIIAAMFSATMGNLSSHFNVRASVLTNDVYRRLCRPHAGEKELVTAGRAMTVIIGGLTVLMAVILHKASAEDLFKYMMSLAGCTMAPLGLPMLVGLVSRRVTPRGAATALVLGTILSVILFVCLPTTVVLQGIDSKTVEGVTTKALMFQIPLEREVVTFAFSFLVVMAIMFGHSFVWPMTETEAKRADVFHDRLATPVGQLPEDQPKSGEQEEPFSPFRLVGICVICIGLLMLSIQPWIEAETMVLWLNVGLGSLLIVLGALMMWASWLSTKAKRAAKSGT